MASVLLIGTLDTKGPETAWLRDRVQAHGCSTLILDSGILGEAEGIVADFSRQRVAREAGTSIEALRAAGTRGKAVEEMLKGVRALALELHAAGRLHGVVALGGAEGSVLAAAAMGGGGGGGGRGVGGGGGGGEREFAGFVGATDVTVMHSVVDILGLNAVSRPIFDNAAAAIAGMAKAYAARQVQPEESARPAIAATMLGNTTRPLMLLREQIEAEGYDFVIFHANGVGGAAMDQLIAQNAFAAVVDYTLSELAGHMAGGFHDAGPHRMDAGAAAGIPQLIVPGCLDFMVFGAKHEVPDLFRDRPMYYHNPEFTLVRLSDDEQMRAAQMLLDKLNACTGRTTLLIPRGGGSIMDVEGGAFWRPELNDRMIALLKNGLKSGIRCREVDAHINSPTFAQATYEELMQLLMIH
jgi:uncharacterized protein (UPF0261 family)